VVKAIDSISKNLKFELHEDLACVAAEFQKYVSTGRCSACISSHKLNETSIIIEHNRRQVAMTSTMASNHVTSSQTSSCPSPPPTKPLHATTLQEGGSFSQCFSKAVESAADDATEEKEGVAALQVSWMKTKEELLDTKIRPVGSFIRKDWQLVEELIRDINRLLKFASAPKVTIIQECFRLLDRLCQEAEVLKQGQEQYNQRTNESYHEQRDDEDTWRELTHGVTSDRSGDAQYLPYDIRLLAAVVASWSQVLRWQKKKKKKNNDAIEIIRRRKINQDHHHLPIGKNTCNATTYTEMVLSANEVLDKVAKYASSGLFSPDRIIYTTIIDAIDDNTRPLAAAWLADRVVQGMAARARYDPFDQVHHPNETTMLYLIQRWAQAAGPRKAEEYLAQLLQWYRVTERPDMRPTVEIYVAVITAWGNHANGKRNPGISWTRIPELYEEMKLVLSEDFLQDEDSLPAYNTICHAVIEAYSKRGCIDQAEGVLQKMEDLFYQTFDDSIRPSSACYGDHIWAYAVMGNTPQVEATLLRMAQVVAPGVGRSDLSSDIHCWTGVLKAWTKSSGEAVTKEQTSILVQWLEEMSKKKTSDGSSASSDWSAVKNYNALVGCFAHSPNSQQGARLAEFVLQWMEEQPRAEGASIPLPDGKTYLACITAWRNAKNPVRAQNILFQCCDKLQKRNTGASVIDRRHFNVAMAAWSESGFPKHLSADRAHKLLDYMGSFYLTPDVVTFSTLIKAWIRSVKPTLAAKKAEALLQNMKEQCLQGNTSVKPNLMTYNSVIAAVSRCQENSAPERAQALFAEMQQGGLVPDRITYNSLMALFLRRSRPDLVEALFRDLVHGFQRGGDASLKPDMQAYTTLLQAWSRVGEPERTVEVLNEMITKCEVGELDGRPTTRVFDAVLQAWLRSNRPDAPTQASKGLERMLFLSESGRFDCRPNLYSYSTVISTYTRSRAPNAGQGALLTLRRLQALYQRTGDSKCRPSPVAYAQVMIALCFASTLEASRSFEQLLTEIQENDTLHWSEESVAPTFRKVVRELEHSHMPHKQSLLASLRQLMEHRGFFRTAEESF
jgi:pentatricopeptide repeat protein